MKKLALILLLLPTLACASGVNNPTAFALPLPGGGTNYWNAPSTSSVSHPFGVVGGSFTAVSGTPAIPSFNFSAQSGNGIYFPVQPTNAIAAANWNTSTHIIAQTAHGLYMTSAVTLTTSGSLPSGLSLGTTYFVIWVDVNSFALASTPGNAANGIKVVFTTQGSGNHTVNPITTHDVGIAVNGAWVLMVSSGTNDGTGVSGTGQVFIGGRNAPTQPSEQLHVEGTGNVSQDFSADIIIYNTHPDGHAARVIADSDSGAVGKPLIYMTAYGAADSGNFWSGGPSAVHATEILMQNGSVHLYRSLDGSTSTYFYNDQAHAMWSWNHGSSGTQDFLVTDASVTIPNNLVMGSGATISGGAGYNTIYISSFTTSSSTSTAGTGSWQKTNITRTVTPHSVNSRFEVSFTGLMDVTATTAFCDLQFYRNNTTQLNSSAGQVTYNSSVGTTTYLPAHIEVLDDPATLSATTYTVYFQNSGVGGLCQLCSGSYQCYMSVKEYVR